MAFNAARSKEPQGLPGTYGAWIERTRQLRYEDDPDRHYYNAGLGQLDNDDDDGSDEEEDRFATLSKFNAKIGHSEHVTEDHFTLPTPLNADMIPNGNWLIGPNAQIAAANYAANASQPMRSFDIQKHREKVEESDSSTDSEAEDSETNSSGSQESLQEEERFEWSNMLGNVLSGDVFKTEKSRLISTLPNDDDILAQRVRMGPEIWIGVRAYTKSRTNEEENIRLKEARTLIDTIIKDVLEFRVMDGSDFHSAAIQVGNVLARIDYAMSMYPSTSALINDKPAWAEENFLARTQALQSWSTVTRRIKMHIDILRKWTGNEELEVDQPGAEILDPVVPSEGNSEESASRDRVLDTSSFIERILKEESFTKTFEKRTITDIAPLITSAKAVITSNHKTFLELNLPPFSDDLNHLSAFPITLMHAALKLRLDYVTGVNKGDPSLTLINQLTDDFRACLILATRMKKDFLELNTPDAKNGWNPPDLTSVMSQYETVLIDALKFFFKLLAWKLRSGGKTVYLKETDIVEHEWKFLSSVTEMIEGGDVLVAEHFSMITHRLIGRVGAYFDENVEVLQRRNMSMVETSRWFNQTLDNVRQRHRKLLRFGLSMIQRFENAAEYYLDDIDFGTFVAALAETEHFLIYTGYTEQQGLYMVGSPSLHNRPALVKTILTRCYPPPRSTAAQGVGATVDAAEIPPDSNQPSSRSIEEPSYVLILTPREPFIWTGSVMSFEYYHGALDTRERRVRLIADGPLGRLTRAKQRLCDLFPVFKDSIALESLAHMGGVNRETRKIKSIQFRLAQSILSEVVPRVREVFISMKGGEALLANFFSFASDLGTRTLRSLDYKFHARLVPLLLQFANNWVTFICDDCIPSDSRTFKWAVQALEFVHMTTREDNILTINRDEFAQLRAGVASCMTLLISHFDVLGARSSFAARKESEKEERGEHRRVPESTLEIPPLDALGFVEGVDVLYASEEFLKQIKELEEARHQIESEMRMVGRVLDKERPEDRGLLFLASSNSHISIRWQQGRFIGGGTFGQVYLGVRLDSGELMAVKEIRFQDLASAPHLITTIRDEMRVMEMLRHPNIVEYYGMEVHRDRVYIFEEYCEGGSLGSLVEHGRIEDETVLQLYTLQLLDGLIYLHSQNIVHRDIKPDNILLDHLGVIKYVDFGAAKILGKEMKTMQARTRMGATKGEPAANSLTGTPSYMAPEVIKGEHKGVQGAMDVWGLGCVVLECATGKRPWGGLDNEWAIMFQIGIAARPPPLPDESQLSLDGIDFIRQCLTIDANKRPTAAELMDNHPWITNFRKELAQTYEDETSGMVPPNPTAKHDNTLEEISEEAEADL